MYVIVYSRLKNGLCLVFIEVYLIYNVVLVSAVQQRDSFIHINISILLKILFPLRLL